MRIKELCEERGMTIEELARQTHLQKRHIAQITTGDACSVGTAIKLADALGVTLDELCRDEYFGQHIFK